MYSTVGTAPNRKFEVTFCGEAMYSCTTQWITSQIIIYETSNIAEVHIGHHTYCTSWNGGYAECGVKNAAGSSAVTAPGRDYPANWNATNEAWRFTPSGATYTVASIPYSPVPYAASAVYWYDSSTGAYLGTGTSITLTPTVTTTYMAAAIGCNHTSKAFYTAPATGSAGSSGGSPHITSIASTNPVCGAMNGSITLFGLKPHFIDSVFVSIDGVPQPIIVDSASLDSTITLTGLGVGTYTIYVKVGPCPSNTVVAVLTTVLLNISGETFTNPTLCGLCNGSITLKGLWPDNTATVNYEFNGTLSTYTGMVGSDSTLTIPGLCGAYPSANYTSISATIGACTATGTDITLNDPPVSAINVNPTVCGKNDGEALVYLLPADSTFVVNYTGGGPDILTVSALDTLTVPALTGGSYSITASIRTSQCTTTVTLTNPPVTAAFDTTIQLGCRGDQVTFVSNGTPAGYHNTWAFGDGTSASTDFASTTHLYNDYPADSGSYWVTLTYYTYAGVPGCTATASEFVQFNHVIASNYDPTDTTICLNPVSPITFNNLSYGTGLTYAWTFGDGTGSTDMTPVHNYQTGGVFQTSLTVTDFLGCDSTISGTVDVIKVGIATVTHDTTVCLVRPMEMMSHPSYVPGTFTSIAYEWAPTVGLIGNGDTINYFFGTPGVYQYTVTATTTPMGCQATDTETVIANPPITLVNLTANQTIVYGASIQLNADGADYYEWFPNDGTLTNNNINDPVARPLDSTTYVIVGTSILGCRDTGYITITIDNGMQPIIPSAFTPNGDGLNDKFRVTNLRYEKLVEMRVFDRWGVEVYHTSNGDEGWDGTFNGAPQDIGTYTYAIVLARVDGTNKVYTGSVTLLR